ncbi:hypothetical protein Acy02nite_71810 [Actinoplanes cyaneus]|uniref:Uncharacterized protein n=1 Tax=Actinoplanes cyaneus TaxID=52696 RepID=A0A919ING1_9ACTN|nr:hypothetical protein [Actinoplanes cyaneus]MCW2142281.1 hypothetical protein [Actinoplanes cyaneus]GID69300.1 hypothetical protein Acy02nite_71810 [Actinoplanes cyaneus]
MDHARAPKAAVAAAVIILVDAVVALLTAIAAVLPTFAFFMDGQPGSFRFRIAVATLAVMALLALVCPAAAVLVGAVRTRRAYLTGAAVTTVVALAAAAQAPLQRGWDSPVPLIVTVIVFTANILGLFLVIGCLRPDTVPPPAWREDNQDLVSRTAGEPPPSLR